jgi:serine/threonine-protein kinase
MPETPGSGTRGSESLDDDESYEGVDGLDPPSHESPFGGRDPLLSDSLLGTGGPTRRSGEGRYGTSKPSLEVSLATGYSLPGDGDGAKGSWFGSVPPPPEEDALIGTTLSNTYEVLRILGEGGMGRVYEAQHNRIAGKRFAVKALHPEFARRKDVLVRFQREVEAAASINSPHVVGVYDVGETDDGRPYLVCELLEGEELGEYLEKINIMSIAPAVRVVRQICRALLAAHDKGVIHRDIKPENVFLSGSIADPVVKVLDFGISRLEGPGGNTLTKTGMVMGTPSYMAPEQARGERVDHRTDIYATGAILYRSVTGVIPFDRADATATLAAVLTEEPERPRALAPHIPEHLELVIQRAMARNPEERFQSIADFDAALAPYDEDVQLKSNDAAMSGARPRMPSQATIMSIDAARVVGGARPQAFLLALLAALGLVMILLSATGGLIRILRDGGAVRPTESLVVALVVAVGLATPLVLLIRHLQTKVWANTARVIELVYALRDPILVGLACAGFAGLLLRVLETMFLRTTGGAGWAPWDVVVPLAGAAGAATTHVVRRLQMRRVPITGAVVAGLGGLLLSLGVVATATLRSDALFPAATAPAPSDSASAAPAGSASAEGDDADEVPSAPPEAASGERSGESYEVWKRFYFEVRQGKNGAALDSLDRLLTLDPSAAEDSDVRNTVMQLAVRVYLSGGDTSDKMTRILTQKMGSTGPDLLFELVVTRGGTAAAKIAEKLLEDEGVRSRGSAGMRVAYAIRSASSCEAKRELVPRAAKEGDYRAVRELRILQSCRMGKRCCYRDEADIKQAISKIESR